jgi:hypothetical protein
MSHRSLVAVVDLPLRPLHSFCCQKCHRTRITRTANWRCPHPDCGGEAWSKLRECHVCNGPLKLGSRHHCRRCGFDMCKSCKVAAVLRDVSKEPTLICTACIAQPPATAFALRLTIDRRDYGVFRLGDGVLVSESAALLIALDDSRIEVSGDSAAITSDRGQLSVTAVAEDLERLVDVLNGEGGSAHTSAGRQRFPVIALPSRTSSNPPAQRRVPAFPRAGAAQHNGDVEVVLPDRTLSWHDRSWRVSDVSLPAPGWAAYVNNRVTAIAAAAQSFRLLAPSAAGHLSSDDTRFVVCAETPASEHEPRSLLDALASTDAPPHAVLAYGATLVAAVLALHNHHGDFGGIGRGSVVVGDSGRPLVVVDPLPAVRQSARAGVPTVSAWTSATVAYEGFQASDAFFPLLSDAVRPRTKEPALSMDAYSVGVYLHLLFFGCPPPPEEPSAPPVESALSFSDDLPAADSLSSPRIDVSLAPDAKDLIASLLHEKPNARRDALRAACGHRCFAGIRWEALANGDWPFQTRDWPALGSRPAAVSVSGECPTASAWCGPALFPSVALQTAGVH